MRSWLRRPSSSRWCSMSRSRSLILRLFSSSMSARWSSCSSRDSSRRSRAWSSARLARASSSASRCCRSFSSLASRIRSFCCARASATMRAALSWADLMRLVGQRRRGRRIPRRRLRRPRPRWPRWRRSAPSSIPPTRRDECAGRADENRARATHHRHSLGLRERGGPRSGSARSPPVSRLARSAALGPRPVEFVAYYGEPDRAGGDRRAGCDSRCRRVRSRRSGDGPRPRASPQDHRLADRHTSGEKPLRASSA